MLCSGNKMFIVEFHSVKYVSVMKKDYHMELEIYSRL